MHTTILLSTKSIDQNLHAALGRVIFLSQLEKTYVRQ